MNHRVHQLMLSFPPLARRRALQVGLVALSLLSLSGLSEMWFGYRESRQELARLQAAQADAAAREIEQYLRGVVAGLRDAAKFPWGGEGFDLARQQQELHRLMVLFPALAEVRTEDGQGRLLVAVSRTEPDRQGPGVLAPRPRHSQAALAGPTHYGRPFFRNGSEPYVEVSVGESSLPGDRTARGRTVGVLHLRLVADVLERVGLALGGQAWLVDEADRLIVHPVQLEMLRQRSVAGRADVQAARQALAASQTLPTAMDSQDLDGQATLSTAVRLADTGWLLVLAQPRSVVLAPALATLWRTGAFMALGVLLAVAASLWQGRRLAAPVLALRQASARIASGDFSGNLALNTGDELALLAQDLNQMARRLASFYEELEAQVAQRTAQLSQARDVAERANLAKTRFLAAASHDLRQPMHTIGLLVGVLRSRLPALPPPANGPEAQALLGKLSGSVEVMERLFSSLLDISKLDAGLVQAHPETFALHELLQRLVSQFEPQAQAAGLRLHLAPCHALVRSDIGLLERCLVNLLGNAIRYTPPGGRVLLGCRRRGDHLALQVIDTGPGIAEADQARIFEEFVRLPPQAAGSTRPAGSQGLGLGLAIVQRTAAVLGHPLALRSTPGRGACFELRLPSVNSFVPSAQPLAAEPAVERLKGLFVMVVDDDPDNRQALEVLCQRWGCLVASAADAASALAELDQHLRTPELLVTDLQLATHAAPGAATADDGLQLVSRLRQATGEDTPALLLTADTSATTAARAQALGVPVLHKPVSAQRLQETLCLLVQHSHPVANQPPLSA